ncbi:MAG: zf-HC2 domain-containing protein [Oscillospiraceae bacterium]|nr:zf-HC2 domain-containing protein [Oscillospiraceae bacterium]
MHCDDIYLTLLSGHIDGTNSEAEEAELQEHLTSCSHCRELLESMEQAEALLAECKAVPPADLSDRIMCAVRKEPRQTKKRKTFYFSTAAAGLVAAALLCFAFLGDRLPPLEPTADSAQQKNTAAEYAGGMEETKVETGLLSEDSVLYDYSFSAEAAEEQSGAENGSSSTVTASTQAEEPQAPEPAEDITIYLPAVDHKKDASSHGSLSQNDNGTAVPAIPTLVIWDASADEIPLLKDADIMTGEDGEPVPNSSDSLQTGNPTLYKWITAAVEAETLSKSFPRASSFTLTVYSMEYSLFCELFESLVGEYEVAFYFPEEINAENGCQILLLQYTEE